MRFEFTSGDATSYDFSEDDGFHIDDLKIIKSITPLIPLPVHFISFTGRLLPDQTVRLDWNAVTDQLHDYFEVEKSVNGTNFTTIGKGPSSAPYWKTDPSPYTGNNYYRIKQVDKDGTVTYSTTINVYFGPKRFTAAVYPNPVTDILNVKINSDKTDHYEITITDLTGRIVYEEKIMTGTAEGEVNINFKQRSSGVYVLLVRNGRNEIVASQKVIKQ